MNDFYVFISIIILVPILIVAYKKKSKNNAKAILDNIKDYNFDKVYLSDTMGVSIGYDSNQKYFCFVEPNGDANICDAEAIIGCEIIVDEKAVKSYSISRAIAGGLLAGSTGAVIGGLSGKQKNPTINRIDLKVNINDVDKPFFKINFLNTETKKEGFIYNIVIEEVEKWEGIMKTIIHNNQQNL